MEHPLKVYRHSRGLSLQRLAERVNTTKSTLSRVEAGLLQPSFGLLRRIVEATEGDVTADALVAFTRPTASTEAA